MCLQVAIVVLLVLQGFHSVSTSCNSCTVGIARFPQCVYKLQWLYCWYCKVSTVCLQVAIVVLLVLQGFHSVSTSCRDWTTDVAGFPPCV